MSISTAMLNFCFIIEQDELAPGSADGPGRVGLRVRAEDLHLLLRGNLPSFVVASMLQKSEFCICF